MKQPHIRMMDGRFVPFTEASDDSLQRCVNSGPEFWSSEHGDPPDGLSIAKSIAAHILIERDGERAGSGTLK